MLCLIQARMSSQRLPGKVLMPVSGIPLLKRVHGRVSLSKAVSKIIVATSTSASDLPLINYCHKNDIDCRAGALDDVAGRLLRIAEEERASAFIRISADSPFIDFRLIDEAVSYFNAPGSERYYDLITNVSERTYPRGQSVEIIRTESLKQAYARFRDKEDFEHVSYFFYKNRNAFQIFNFSNSGNLSQFNMCIDSESDLSRCEASLAICEAGDLTWQEIFFNMERAGGHYA